MYIDSSAVYRNRSSCLSLASGMLSHGITPALIPLKQRPAMLHFNWGSTRSSAKLIGSTRVVMRNKMDNIFHSIVYILVSNRFVQVARDVALIICSQNIHDDNPNRVLLINNRRFLRNILNHLDYRVNPMEVIYSTK